MGSVIRANCACGYEGKFWIGVGLTNLAEDFQAMAETLGLVLAKSAVLRDRSKAFKPLRSWLFPCLCRDCERIVVKNLLKIPFSCPDCLGRNMASYDQPELCAHQGDNVVEYCNMREELGRELKLTDGEYYCPSCDSYRLKFVKLPITWD